MVFALYIALTAILLVRANLQLMTQAMASLGPDELRFRITKEPFSPDYHDRYNRQLKKAREFVTHVANMPLIQEIVDIKRLKSELDYSMQTNRCSTGRDFMSMHTIPSTIYLMAFLLTFA